MPLEIDGIRYIYAKEVADNIEVTRQTLWRWRREGKIPAGHRFRNRQVVFTEREAELIREHANRIEPLNPADAKQMPLF